MRPTASTVYEVVEPQSKSGTALMWSAAKKATLSYIPAYLPVTPEHDGYNDIQPLGQHFPISECCGLEWLGHIRAEAQFSLVRNP